MQQGARDVVDGDDDEAEERNKAHTCETSKEDALVAAREERIFMDFDCFS